MHFRHEAIELTSSLLPFDELVRVLRDDVARRHGMTLVGAFEEERIEGVAPPMATSVTVPLELFEEVNVTLDRPRATARFIHREELEEGGIRFAKPGPLPKTLDVLARFAVGQNQRDGVVSLFAFSGSKHGEFGRGDVQAIRRNARVVASLLRRTHWRSTLVGRCMLLEQLLTASVVTGLAELNEEGRLVWTSKAGERTHARILGRFFCAPGEDKFDKASQLRRVQNAGGPLASLSAREVEVLAKLCEGKKNKEIAKALFVSSGTVRTHLSHIFAKLEVTSRTQAVLLGRLAGL